MVLLRQGMSSRSEKIVAGFCYLARPRGRKALAGAALRRKQKSPTFSVDSRRAGGSLRGTRGGPMTEEKTPERIVLPRNVIAALCGEEGK